MSDINSFNDSAEVQDSANSSESKKPRRRKRIIIASIIVFFLVTGIAGLGFTKGFYDNHRGDGGPMRFIMEMVINDLDLNEQQKAKVEKIKSEIKAKMDSKKENKQKDMTEMEQMFRSDNFDKTKALEISKKHDANREEMKSFTIDQMAKFHSILTTEQRNKAADKMKEFREKRNECKKKWKKDKRD